MVGTIEIVVVVLVVCEAKEGAWSADDVMVIGSGEEGGGISASGLGEGVRGASGVVWVVFLDVCFLIDFGGAKEDSTGVLLGGLADCFCAALVTRPAMLSAVG